MAPVRIFAIIDLTAGEILIILVFGLIVLGPERLPEVARTAGEWMAKFRRVSSNLQQEMREVLDDPAMKPLREVGEFVAQPRKKLTEMALAIENDAAKAEAPEETPAETPEETPAETPDETPAETPEAGEVPPS